MGGLLAADAATHPSNNPDQYPGAKPKRIVGVVAFDTPYLGMHPHVVVSGIASLLPKGNEPGKERQSDGAMNDHKQVKIVDEKVTDDWEEYRKNLRCALLDSRFSCACINSIYQSIQPRIRILSRRLRPDKACQQTRPFEHHFQASSLVRIHHHL